jgi:low affinity Fe/Cu permease
MNAWFSRVANVISKQAGSSWFFMASLVAIVAWLVCGPFYGWSDGWQLIMNSATTVLTWQLAILILHVTNRDTKALHLKLDELVLRLPGPRDELAGAEDLPEAELERLKQS